MRRRGRSRGLVVAAALAALSVRASAAAAAADPPPAVQNEKDEARARFEQGVELLQRGAWSDALVAFSTSARLYPTPQAINNAAICLRKLGRHDEALERVEALLHDFPDLSAEKRLAAEREAAELARLVGAIAVEGAEPGAQIVIDGRERGAASSPLRVLTGSHLVRALKEGFLPFEARVEVHAEQTTRITISMTRRPPEAAARPEPAAPSAPPPPRRFSLELAGAMLIAPSFGGEVAASCDERCNASLGLGGYVALRGSYEIEPSLEVGLSAGFLAAQRTLANRRVNLTPPPQGVGVDPVDDTFTLRGGLLGIWVGKRFGERPFLDLRLGAGALLGSTSDVRAWIKNATVGNSDPPFREEPLGAFLYLDPEVRVGVHLGEHLSLAVGLEALVLLAVAAPAWPGERVFSDSRYGDITFDPETLAGPVVLTLLPGVSARYTF